jgi:hypothetical protein
MTKKKSPVPPNAVATAKAPVPSDPVNHPPHYTSHPSGIECITISKHHDFCIGNAIKYLWRAGLKKSSQSDPSTRDTYKEIEDLKKAVFYINQKITDLSNTPSSPAPSVPKIQLENIKEIRYEKVEVPNIKSIFIGHCDLTDDHTEAPTDPPADDRTDPNLFCFNGIFQSYHPINFELIQIHDYKTLLIFHTYNVNYSECKRHSLEIEFLRSNHAPFKFIKSITPPVFVSSEYDSLAELFNQIPFRYLPGDLQKLFDWFFQENTLNMLCRMSYKYAKMLVNESMKIALNHEALDREKADRENLDHETDLETDLENIL